MKNLPSLCAALLLTAALFSCTNSPKRTDTASGQIIPIHNNGVSISYTDVGKNDTAILFVHGWAINKGYWSAQAKYFGKRYRVITMDLPGFGASGKNRNDWTTATYAKDVDTVIKALNLKKVILVGHSMSGDIVLQSAVDNPHTVIGLVGIDNFKNPGTLPTEKDKKDFANALDQLRHHYKAVATGYSTQMLFSKTTPEAVKKRVLNDVVSADSVIAIAAMADQADFDEIAMLKRTGKKLYLISSDVTPTDTTHLAAQKVPFKIFYIHGSGHYPMNEQPEAFNMALDKVLWDMDKR